MFSPPLKNSNNKKTNKQKKLMGMTKVCPSKCEYLPFLCSLRLPGVALVGCPATLEGTQGVICCAAWEVEGDLGRQHVASAIPKCHRALLCLLCPQLKGKVLFHLFWQLNNSPCKTLKLSSGCDTRVAQCKKNHVGINGTKIPKHEGN